MEIIERFGGVFDETYDRFAMQYSFKTEEDGKGDRSRNFIFNDLQFHSVFEGENAFIDIDTDMKAKQNWLRFTKRRPTEKDGGVLSLLASVKGCLTYFQNGARNLSFNYKHHKDEDKRPGDDDYTFENAIESVLTEFHLSREQIRYLKPIVMGGQVKSKKDKKDSNGKMSLKYFDRSVYDRGFRYYDFIDDPNHSMRSEIQLFDFQDSPERILLHLSEKAQIIGISATATLDTVIGNYDLEYLQRMLQDKFYVMPEVDKCRLQESFRTFVANYDKVNIHVEPVCYSTDDTAELAEIFNGNEALIKKYAEKLSISFERVEYAKNNFIRVVKVMKAFILNESVKSFLCLNNKLPQENKGLFDIKLLEEFADAIIKLYGIKGLKGKDLLYSINSEDYDAKRVEFIQRLSKGEKLFVISSYNTVGAGQNLQYKAPGNATIVAVNDYDRGDMEKDFDYIYLEKPTNLLVNVDSKKGIEAEDLIRFVYQMEFLMERGEVSRKDGIAVIKDAFICFSGGYTFSGKKGEPYKTDSVNNYALRTLIQAVGRICRTGLKNPDIYIYVPNYEAFMEALRRSAPVPITFEAMAADTDGYFSADHQKIAIRQGMSEVQTVSATVHEIAHSKLHDPKKYEMLPSWKVVLESEGGTKHDFKLDFATEKEAEQFASDMDWRYVDENQFEWRLAVEEDPTTEKQAIKNRHTEEVEAESISYAVCKYFGIETGENSFGYIASWSQGKELKRAEPVWKPSTRPPVL